jgi:hypothetical protein
MFTEQTSERGEIALDIGLRSEVHYSFEAYWFR